MDVIVRRSRFTLAAAFVMLVLLAAPGLVFAARPGPSGQWSHANGPCGNTVDLATQGYTGFVFAAVQSNTAACNGVFRSADGGVNFSKVGITYVDHSPPRIFDLSKGPGARIYAGTSDGIWYTDSETMVTWTRVANGLPNNGYVVTAEAYMVDWVPGTIEVYATLATDVSGGGLYRSVDGGQNWSLVAPGVDAVSVNHGTSCGIDGSLVVVAAARTNPWGQPGGLWVSRDDGLSWARSSTWPTNRAMDVGWDCSNNSKSYKNFGALWVTNGDPSVNAAVYRSSDLAQTFQPDNQGIPTCCASTVSEDGLFHTYGDIVGTWAPSLGGGDGMYTRSRGSSLGAAWSKYPANGLPVGASITDWVRSVDPLTGISQFVVIVNGGVYYKR